MMLKATLWNKKINNCVAYSISSVAETRDRASRFSREVDFMRWFPVALLL